MQNGDHFRIYLSQGAVFYLIFISNVIKNREGLTLISLYGTSVSDIRDKSVKSGCGLMLYLLLIPDNVSDLETS